MANHIFILVMFVFLVTYVPESRAQDFRFQDLPTNVSDKVTPDLQVREMTENSHPLPSSASDRLCFPLIRGL